MSHANAALTPVQRLRLARKVVDEEWTVAAAAEYFRVSWRTADRRSKRYVEMGVDGMQDRSSRPNSSPNRTPQQLVRKVIHLRWKQRLGPVGIAARLGMPASTVHAVLVRCHVHRLNQVDVKTGEPARRYEHDAPGALIHVDVKKLGDMPDGGGWRSVGRVHGFKHGSANAAMTGLRDRHSGAAPGPRSSTPSSTTTPASPTPRSTATRPQRPRSGSCKEPCPGSLPAA